MTATAQVLQSPSLVQRVAQRFSVDPEKMLSTLKATAFRQRADRKTGEVREPSNEEMMALLILAETYRLNPFTRELFAFMDPKSGAIIPVVSVDGWIRIINEQPALRSLSFRYSDDMVKHKGKSCHAWMEVEFVRSDRDKPIVIREYFAEVVRDVDFATPWDSHPNRMHRHKTLIQGARVAFGFGGIYDEDEAHRIIDGESTRIPEGAQSAAVSAVNAAVAAPAAIEHAPGVTVPPMPVEGQQAELVPAAGPGAILADPEQKTEPAKGKGPTFADVGKLIHLATKERKPAILDDAAELARGIENEQHRREANIQIADARKALDDAAKK